MQQLLWKDHLRDGTRPLFGTLRYMRYAQVPKRGRRLLEEPISFTQNSPSTTVNSDGDAKKWDVWGGEARIERIDSQDTAEAALLRLGLAYSVLPSPVFEKRKEEVKQWAS